MSQRSERRIVVISPLSFLYLIIAGVLAWAVWNTLGIMVSLFAAAVFATALNPLVNYLERNLKIRRGIAVVVIMLGFVLALGLVVYIVVPAIIGQVQSISAHWKEYRDQMQTALKSQPMLLNAFNQFTQKLSRSDQISSQISGYLTGVVGSFLGALTFFVFLIYMLVSGKHFANYVADLLPNSQHKKRFLTIAHDVSYRLGYWLRGQAVLCLIIAVMSFVVLTIFGIPYALSLAILAGLFEAVPMIGAYLGAILPIVVAFTISPWRALIILVAFIIMQQVEGNVFVPLVMRKALGIHPLVVLLAALIGGSLFGFVGVLVAVPVTAAVSVILGSINKEAVIERAVASTKGK
ncbi:AI-2E family transporter [Candidatus Saccharibacteria bacterium]|nr:AI-2E family transporter [Candidatus Saccharibacteria bacterium]